MIVRLNVFSGTSCTTSYLVQGEAELDHPVDAVAEGVGVVQREAAGQHRRLEQQQHQVLHRLVALVRVRPLLQLLSQQSKHDGVAGTSWIVSIIALSAGLLNPVTSNTTAVHWFALCCQKQVCAAHLDDGVRGVQLHRFL